ncbi:glutamate racemase [Prosthecobacter debontii]|uniref:Glutamate racemase n=1 Tax=Prosthecobacter debontii TaxID=48467 RepID=A0A1T4Z4A7_9BACT|nr:glutamate racemase [Prosthecobacter debontii]SKB08870.1 glutamate racemase [Prosthecobacter debontii]
MTAPDSSAPLGVFDSGVGGLTVVRALRELLPNESIIYLGDTARVPYGSKSPDTIRRFSVEDTQFLVSHGVKAVVVACNTATAHALPALQATFRVPIIGVLEPGVEATLADGTCERVGIIGTAGTIRSSAYQYALAMRQPDLQIHAMATPLLVPFVEEGWIDHPALKSVLREYLKPLLDKGMDTLVLGCTHYPLLVPVLKRMLGNKVRLVDSASTCAAHTKTLLEKQNLLRTARSKPTLEIYLTDLAEQAEALAKRFLGTEFGKVKKATL